MDAPDHYQTTYDSKTKIVVFYSLSNQSYSFKEGEQHFLDSLYLMNISVCMCAGSLITQAGSKRHTVGLQSFKDHVIGIDSCQVEAFRVVWREAHHTSEWQQRAQLVNMEWHVFLTLTIHEIWPRWWLMNIFTDFTLIRNSTKNPNKHRN